MPESTPAPRPERTFTEPWHAQVFALTVALHRAGHFEWTAWAELLGAEIAAADSDDGGEDVYYRHWLAALEKMVVRCGLGDDDALAGLSAVWRNAYEHTPHGAPVEPDAFALTRCLASRPTRAE